MGAMLTKCFGSVVNDPKKLEMIVGKSFGMFDKDHSGQIDAAEARACAEQVLKMAGVTNVPAGQIDSVFNKVAGSDQKLDKAEFTLLVNQVLKKAGVTTAPVTAAPIAAPAAEAAAAAPVAAQ